MPNVKRPPRRGRPLGRPNKVPDDMLSARLMRKFRTLSPATMRLFAFQVIDHCREHLVGFELEVVVQSIATTPPDTEAEQQDDRKVATG